LRLLLLKAVHRLLLHSQRLLLVPHLGVLLHVPHGLLRLLLAQRLHAAPAHLHPP
jgi:hypothetical protein